MKNTATTNARVYAIIFARVYPMYIAKFYNTHFSWKFLESKVYRN